MFVNLKVRFVQLSGVSFNSFQNTFVVKMSENNYHINTYYYWRS